MKYRKKEKKVKGIYGKCTLAQNLLAEGKKNPKGRKRSKIPSSTPLRAPVGGYSKRRGNKRLQG